MSDVIFAPIGAQASAGSNVPPPPPPVQDQSADQSTDKGWKGGQSRGNRMGKGKGGKKGKEKGPGPCFMKMNHGACDKQDCPYSHDDEFMRISKLWHERQVWLETQKAAEG